MAPMEAWDTSIPAIRQACLQQLLWNGRIPRFNDRHEKTQEDKKAPTGRIPTATSDCYSLHHRLTEPEKQQRRTNQRSNSGRRLSKARLSLAPILKVQGYIGTYICSKVVGTYMQSSPINIAMQIHIQLTMMSSCKLIKCVLKSQICMVHQPLRRKINKIHSVCYINR